MRQKEQGYTLFELLIALSLALFLSSIVVNIFAQWKKAYFFIQSLNETQENARIAFSWLKHDIRMAGFIGCVRLMDFSPLNTQLTSDTSLIVWRLGGPSNPSAGINFPPLPHSKPNSDVILVQFLNSHTIPVQSAKANHISLSQRSLFQTNDELLISDCQHAEVFKWGHINLQYIYQADSEVGFLDKVVYYIGDTGRLTSRGRPIYALYRRNLNKSLNNPIELVEGVESMFIRLGVQHDVHKGLLYLRSNQIKKWSDIKSIEISLLLGSDERRLRDEWKYVIALRERIA